MSCRAARFRHTGTSLQRGFTLLELLVVTSMIAILVTLAVVSFNLLGGNRELDQQATRMAAILEVVSEEAQMQGRDFGIELMLEGYRFVEYDPFFDTWFEVTDDDLLRQRQLGGEMEFGLRLEGRQIQLPLQAEELEEPEDPEEVDPFQPPQLDRDLSDDYLPHILLMSSGDISPFEVTIYRLFDEATIGIRKELGKDIEIVRDGDEI